MAELNLSQRQDGKWQCCLHSNVFLNMYNYDLRDKSPQISGITFLLSVSQEAILSHNWVFNVTFVAFPCSAANVLHEPNDYFEVGCVFGSGSVL